jgi:hypothetical protein
MPVAYCHMFTTGETYRERGGDYYQRRDPESLIKRLADGVHHSATKSPSPQPLLDPNVMSHQERLAARFFAAGQLPIGPAGFRARPVLATAW